MGKEPVGHWMCSDGQWTQPADRPTPSCQPVGNVHKPNVKSGTPFFKIHDTTTNTNVDLCIPLNITNLPSNSLAVIDWRNSGDSDHLRILNYDSTTKVHTGNELCSNYNSKSAPKHGKVEITDAELKKLLSTGVTNEGTYQGGQCGGNTYLSPFPRDGRHEFSQDYCHYDSVGDTTDRDVVVCSTLTELNACPSHDGTQQALSSREVSQIDGNTVHKTEYDTKVCLSTVSLPYSEHPKDHQKPSEHSWCQTIEFEHVTGTQTWTVAGTEVDYACELKLKKLFPVIHTTDANGDNSAQLKFEASFQCPTVPGGSNAVTISDIALKNTLLADGSDLSYDSGCDSSAGECLITFTSRPVPKDTTADVLHTAFGGTTDINAAMTITTNNGATDHKAVHALSFALPVAEEKVEVKKSSITVETFHEINNGDESDAAALESFKVDVTKSTTKQLGTGDEMVIRVTMTDTAPLTSSYIYNAGLFLADTGHPMYDIIVNGNEALWHSLITSKTTNHQSTQFWGHSNQLHKDVLADYYQTNCEDAYSSTLCPCNTNPKDQCKKDFINGVYWLDLIKEGVVQEYDEAKFKSERTSAACLEMLPLSSCVAGTSGSYLNVKDTETCSTGYTMETSTDQLATYNGEDLSTASKALARACEVAKGEKASSKSFLGASTQCDAVFKQTTVEIIIGSKALASYLKGTGKDLRKFHTYVEVANIQYYTHGCDSVLASPGRRLLAAAGVTEADVNKVIGAAEVTKELVAVEKQLDDLKALIDVPKASYNSGTAKVAYDSASAEVNTLKAKYEALRGSASSYADQALDWKASATATATKLLQAEAQLKLLKETHANLQLSHNNVTHRLGEATRHAAALKAKADAGKEGRLAADALAATAVGDMSKQNDKFLDIVMWTVIVGLALVAIAIGVCAYRKCRSDESDESEGASSQESSVKVSGVEAKYKPLFRQTVDL